MENKYPRLISWSYWDGTSLFSRKKEVEELTEYYILDKDGEKEIEDGTLTDAGGPFRSVNRTHFKKVVRTGYTRNSKKHKDIYFAIQDKYPELENKLKFFEGILKDCGSYVYVNLPWLSGWRGSDFYSKHEDVFLENNSCYIKKECWTVELINELIHYKPRNFEGGVITDYQEKYIPQFLLSLKIKFPELYKNVDRKTDKDIRELYLGKFIPVTRLNVGTVGVVKGGFCLPDTWYYDGEYLNGTKQDDGLTVEYRIKATDEVLVKIIDVSTVPFDLVSEQ